MLYKRILMLIGAFCLFFIATTVHAAGIKVEGVEKNLSVPLVVSKDTTYIALADFAKLHNIPYSVDTQNKIVTFQYKNENYVLYLNQKKIVSPKGNYSIDIMNVKGYNMLPLRKIHSIFGLYTAYDYNTETVLVSQKEVQDVPRKNQWSISTMKLNSTSKIHVPILCYHVVSEGPADTLYTPYWKLEDHLKTLKANGYTAITPKQLYEAYYLKKALPSKPILITFDDGYYDNYTLAYPLLKKYDMQATIFLIGNAIQEKQNKSTTGGLPKLSWENVKEMTSHVTFQNHTYGSHYKVVGKNGKKIGAIATPLKIKGKWETSSEYWIRIGNDIEKTEKLLKDHVGYGSYIFSYPYGEFSSTTKKVLQELRVPLAVTLKKGAANKKTNVHELPRLVVNGKWTGKQLINQINQLK